MVILLSHTSHALQPLYLSCFKPFKTTFRKERDTTIIKKNYIEPDKIVFGGMDGQNTKPNTLKKKYYLKVQKYRDLITRP